MVVAATASPRLVSIDVLRGLTIALMILVNDPGDWAHVYRQLDHSAWNGFTLTDFVFPNFLFLVGVSIILSLGSRLMRSGGSLDQATRFRLTVHAARRALTLFAIHLFLAAYPHFDVTHLRLFGVLPRIAACYFVVAIVCLWTQRSRTLVLVAAALLLGYWAVMRFVPVPGFGVPTHQVPLLDPDRNLAAWLDRGFNAWTRRTFHTGSLYNGSRDPEGILSTVPAIATTLIGAAAGLMFVPAQIGSRAPVTVTRILTISGFVLLLCGVAWNAGFPINKNLWTSSYALYSAGLSLVLLAVCHWMFEIHRFHSTRLGRILTTPWLVFGANAIAVFVLSELVVETLLAIPVPNPADPSHPLTAWSWPYFHLFARQGSTYNTSLAFAGVFTALCLLPNWLLWRRRIFLRV